MSLWLEADSLSPNYDSSTAEFTRRPPIA